ncbi:MAG: VanW family protein [Oscillospiraceae bacterium]|jgi:vancomycin resistance protein YoaR|nr:VanW family protein [Oscillospiraceae bacterium]
MGKRELSKEPAGEQGRAKNKKIWMISGAAAAVLLGGYLGLCAWVSGSDRILPNVSVAGLDVSGMTAAEAETALSGAMAEHGSQIIGAVSYEDQLWSITAEEMGYGWRFAAESAGAVGRENFLTGGAVYLGQLLGRDHQISAPRWDCTVLDDLVDLVEAETGGSVTEAAYQLDGEALVMTKGKTGQAIDRSQVQDSLWSAVEGAMEQKFSGMEGVVEVKNPLIPQETPPQEPDFQAIHDAVAVEPQNAQYTRETGAVADHVVGVDFDVEALKAAYEKAGEGETFSIPVTLTQPEETKQSLEAKLFRDLLGEGTTNVSGSSARKHNVKLSAQACNGVILMPGEVFSYNNTTGSRSASKGYLAAPVYSGDASVDEVGGGICQTSSTIYYAVLHTNLKIVERRAHRFNTGYVPEGMDATVYYGQTDFRFENSTDYPIKIVTSSYDQGGKRKLNVKIYGTNVDGIRAEPKSTVYETVSPTTQYKADESITQGTTKVDSKQNPYTGKSAQTYRYIYDRDGNLLEKQDMGKSVYKMRPKTILYNPADGDPATWPNGVPPVQAPPPAETVPETPAENTGAETPLEDPGTEAPAESGGGQETPPTEELPSQDLEAAGPSQDA